MMLRKLTSAMVLMGAAGMANASINYVDPASPAMPIQNGPDQTDVTWTNTIAQFNPADHGGFNLNSVHIEDIGGSLIADPGTATCFAPGGNGNCSGSVNSGVNITITGPAGISASIALTLPTFTYDFADVPPSPPFETVPIPGGTANGTATSLWFCIVPDMAGCVINPTIVAAFQGTGTVTFSTLADGNVIVTNGNGSAGANQPLTAASTYRIRYDYIVPDQQAPEPASIALMGIGLAGLGVWRRRKA